ncbi:UNVERIFIED_CONTAM: hypothetical protein K2H54_074965 [Gekko kuhli]
MAAEVAAVLSPFPVTWAGGNGGCCPVEEWRVPFGAPEGQCTLGEHLARLVGPSELLDMADSETGETALHMAACQCHRGICQLLVEAGASLRSTDSKGKTPRDRAQQAGDPDLASYLESRQNFPVTPREDLETAV